MSESKESERTWTSVSMLLKNMAFLDVAFDTLKPHRPTSTSISNRNVVL
jgi:hypothetical protein